ncbi:acyl-CoA/acyl-ACP dehydrogenase [Rhodocytophaga rosea]|uniref:Dibenzothiophene monooxygenase n=1 Tax=Rhodocytophaga rosea TaxID=2704465 RepID=A0A6C0GJT4_9BACT|nr:acyl-CoA dehydrogenase family protein [Rhodocytophaga rosea]QHT68074.1 acyl-CoA/acyl-ACP dehydrogenase [Rhodocytophaga rosea]
METISNVRWQDALIELGEQFAHRASQYDQTNTFVSENYEQLKSNQFFSLAIPEELGGGGASYAEMCNAIRQMAQSCGATALAFSMHQHLIAANIWRYKKGLPAEALLRKVASEQLILVSTGAGDWLSSRGIMEKTEGGYLVTARKHFASQAPVGNILVTSARYLDPEKGPQVLHFPVPFSAKGLTIKNDWDTMGMRGTGSHTIELEKVFVPDAAIALTRPQGEFHPFWNVVLTVAMPLIMSAYVGIAERAAQIAFEKARKSAANVYLLGELQNQLTTAQVLWQDMIRLVNEFDFQPVNDQGNQILIRKTLVANACIATVNKAMETVGGQGFFRHMQLERLFRDVQGAQFHPLTEKSQHYFTGNLIRNGVFPADPQE